MTLKAAMMKALPLVLAACFAGGAVAAGAQDTRSDEKPKVDCQKNPAHPDCKKGN